MTSNAQWWTRAQTVLPGGVNSPVRAFKSVPGDPIFFASAKGSRFTSEDGATYLDYCQSWGPLILGHTDPDVLAAVYEAAAQGLTFGAPHRRGVLLAEAFLAQLPMYEQVRFVSSGTEAVMSAVRLARGATGRDLVLKFSGCYHGHVDALLVKGGSGLATFGQPSSSGVPADFTKHTAVLQLDDPDALKTFFAEHGDTLAALIMEPVPANAGLLLQHPSYLELCRELCTKHGAMLIFDEVISGFRVSATGAPGVYGVTPDIATFGKIIGGGMPVGAYATSKEIMAHVSPLGAVYQAGTLSGNPVAMAAGLATLEKVSAPGFFDALAEKTATLANGIQQRLRDAGYAASVVRIGSLFWIAFQDPAPRSYEAIDPACTAVYGKLHAALLEEGVYLAPSAYEVGFVSAAHSDADIEATLQAFGRAIARMS
ncbi:MAG: glutamate-1-semialdehyde 2,1-aminomutase [Myxococcota bacterium]|jgi:glutamate-1-semialdehyde 2,1-aminomutase